MSDALSRSESRPSADPSRPHGLVVDTDGRILLVDRTEEITDRQFSQVTFETFHALVATERRRLPVDREGIRRDAYRGA
ncbi:hypothetical protein [Nocardia sp. AG03]|uniref:hypothetical protein n=1 Tax=Nocardia sp. AG03 TaxID=3025312 RepID=UPI0024183AA4|nr:hypothetical protein [Nocardia sp. AG03]